MGALELGKDDYRPDFCREVLYGMMDEANHACHASSEVVICRIYLRLVDDEQEDVGGALPHPLY